MEPESSRVAAIGKTSHHVSGDATPRPASLLGRNTTSDTQRRSYTFRDIFLDPDPRIPLWERIKGGASLSLLPFAVFCGGIPPEGSEDAGAEAAFGKDAGREDAQETDGEVQCDPDTYIPENRFRNYDTCGYGICARTVPVTICVDGKIVRNDEECAPGKPLSADDTTCNNVDDDCDGRVDEDFEKPTGEPCGLPGPCQGTEWLVCGYHYGIPSESYGEQTECRNTRPPQREVCNDGIDNDCDGRIDEINSWRRIGESCVVGAGVCWREGVRECAEDGIGENGEGWVCSAVAGEPTGSDDNCDGLDDDCDGETDEHFVPVAITCGTGTCETAGELNCDWRGRLVESCEPHPFAGRSDYTCNGIDDDCDGEIDEDYFSWWTLECGIGACRGFLSSLSLCIDGTIVETESECIPGTPTGLDNDCNGQDDDCDAEVDEHFEPIATVCGAGDHLSEGHLICINGSLECMRGR